MTIFFCFVELILCLWNHDGGGGGVVNKVSVSIRNSDCTRSERTYFMRPDYWLIQIENYCIIQKEKIVHELGTPCAFDHWTFVHTETRCVSYYLRYTFCAPEIRSLSAVNFHRNGCALSLSLSALRFNFFLWKLTYHYLRNNSISEPFIYFNVNDIDWLINHWSAR